jgi:hypothetical protein
MECYKHRRGLPVIDAISIDDEKDSYNIDELEPPLLIRSNAELHTRVGSTRVRTQNICILMEPIHPEHNKK